MVEADEGKQKQHAECVDNTVATQLSKLSDIKLSCAPEQDLGLKSLNPVELRQKSRHPPLHTTGPSTESGDSMVWSFRFSQTFFFNSELMPELLSSTVWPRQFLANRAGTWKVNRVFLWCHGSITHARKGQLTDHPHWSTFSECVIVIVIVGRGLELPVYILQEELRSQRRRQHYPVNQVSSCRGRVIVQFVSDASLFLLVC